MTEPQRLYCTCHGTEHPLVEVKGGALCCENCGNIVCEAQGAGPCIFCGNLFVNEKGSVQDVLLVSEKASPEAKEIARRLDLHLQLRSKTMTTMALNDTDLVAAEQFRQTIFKRVEEAAELDPEQAIIDDQEGLLGFMGD
ncbi:putative zinc finger motif, C2HC5-type domain-containing protein [Giardia muris]|uniref:Putative zinc finger motif, C2HC5-type domain-containing protein n=1 Tax=Giardia muris TaxID=5742 RepID=A0A4Z1T711_GIAMU|nr:putative zinc finger motif, C2HC5-type domain-containing protein [Giardia muris]|eukprot:TNJ28917.1 putative zinc finger motif, C2HC5-type domain-containing protein [Giardia muris]